MPIDWPNTPSDGDLTPPGNPTHKWSSAKGRWEPLNSAGAPAIYITNGAPPVGPFVNGNLWFDVTQPDTLFVWVDDGSSAAWVGITGPVGPEGAQGPIGATGPAGSDGADGADGAQGPAGPSQRELQLSIPGEFVLGPATIAIPNRSGATRTIQSVAIDAGDAPTGSSVIADVELDAVTIFTNQGSRPTIPAGANESNVATPDVTAWVDGAKLLVQLDQVGSTVAGGNAVISIIYNQGI